MSQSCAWNDLLKHLLPDYFPHPLPPKDSAGPFSPGAPVVPSAVPAHWEFITAPTSLQIVTLNEIVEQYVRPDPLTGGC